MTATLIKNNRGEIMDGCPAPPRAEPWEPDSRTGHQLQSNDIGGAETARVHRAENL